MKASIAIDEIISGREYWSYEQPHHHYLLTFLALYARPAEKTISIAAIIRFMDELGSEASSVRSSISRLKKKGVLNSKKTSLGSEYAFSELLEPHMLAGDERIFSPRSMGIGEPWLLVSYSVPESERQNRHKIRSGLTRIGFGTVSSALYIGPKHLHTETVQYIREYQLWDYVQLFIGQPDSQGNLQEKVAQWWNLEGLYKEYKVFLECYQPELLKWQSWLRDGGGTTSDAFKLYIPMVTHWRRLIFMDPGLPLELLPTNWIGTEARQLFFNLNNIISPLSSQYFTQVDGK